MAGSDQLSLASISYVDFKWQPGRTPCSTPRQAAYSVLAYLLTIALLRFAIKKQITLPTWIPALHNLILCLGSLAMFLGAAYHSYQETQQRGTADWMFCLPKGTPIQGPLYFWSYVYYLSKYYELIDTVILVLKAKPLSLLHVFHHSVVVPMAFLWLDAAQSLQQIALLFNTGIHVIMYYYYFLCTLGYRPAWKKLVTNGQIVQFVFSFAISIRFWYLHWRTGSCSGFNAMLFNAGFNLLLLALFINFHRNSYKGSRSSKAKGQ